MTRRPKKRAPGARTIGHKPWSEAFKELFPLAAADWTPPDMVKVSAAPSAQSWTFEARFQRPDGLLVTLKTKCKQLRSGDVQIADQSLACRFVLHGDGSGQ